MIMPVYNILDGKLIGVGIILSADIETQGIYNFVEKILIGDKIEECFFIKYQTGKKAWVSR